MDASVTKRQAFIDQLTAIKNLRANQSSGFTAGDQANATNSMLQKEWASVQRTSEAISTHNWQCIKRTMTKLKQCTTNV